MDSPTYPIKIFKKDGVSLFNLSNLKEEFYATKLWKTQIWQGLIKHFSLFALKKKKNLINLFRRFKCFHVKL